MLLGANLVELIPARLDSQTDEARERTANDFAAYFRKFVNKAVTTQESLEAFAVYRRFDLAQTRGGQSSSIDSMKVAAPRLCDDLAIHFQTIPKPVITNFVSESWGEYASKRSRLFMARSRGTHVAGVLRPLAKRYLRQWEAELVKRFEVGEIQHRVDALLEEPISTLSALEKWAEAVFALFVSVGVYRPSAHGETSSDASSKPSGMISQGSLRTYKQQWFSWISDNASALLAERAVDNTTTADSIPVQTFSLPSGTNSMPMISGIRVTLCTSADPTFRIEKTWASAAETFEDIDTCFDTASKVWPATGAFVISLESTSKATELHLRFEEANLRNGLAKVRAILGAAT